MDYPSGKFGDCSLFHPFWFFYRFNVFFQYMTVTLIFDLFCFYLIFIGG